MLFAINYCPLHLHAASFDCAQASNSLEKTICADSQLSKADEDMAEYYNKLKASLDAGSSNKLLREQRIWLKQRTAKCAMDDAQCLLKVYSDRTLVLRIKYENLVPFDINESLELQGLRSTCAIPELTLSENTTIYAAGAYAGRELNVQIDQSGHQATQFDVIVNSPEKPVVLLLGAYEPSIWNIGWTKRTKILAVVASGNHRQAIAGLPKHTPILISSYDNKGPCGGMYVAKDTLNEINPYSKKIFGKAADMVYFASAGKVIVGEPIETDEEIFTSQDVTPDRFVDKSKPLAGPAGIQDAVRKGLLRRATKADANAWVNAVIQNAPHRDIPPVAGQATPKPPKPSVYNAYVVLKPFTYPAGLYGGNSATFFIPRGVPTPMGNPGHSAVYDFNTLTCQGALCGATRIFRFRSKQ